MKIKSLNVITLILMLLLVASQYSFAERDVRRGGKEKLSLNKTNGQPAYSRFNINRISTWIKNDGETDINQNGNSGFVYPRGSNHAVFFQSGFLWGGTVNGEIRVGGSTYNQGLLPGAVVNGVREDETADHVRIYRVRRDYKTGDLSGEATDEGVTEDEVYNQYDKDWNEWPAAYGAPYEDIDGNGSYDPAVDIPGEPGSDQTVWFVANDFDPVTSQVLYGSLPMGIEMQATVFGYNQTGALGSMLFRKFLIINKSADDFEDFYVCMWSDPDDGDATDDYAGCDTLLSLGYIYNGDADDATYGRNVPAGGFDFFQGPIVDGDETDQAIFKGRVVSGKKNLGMSAFFFFINSDPVYSDPNLGEYAEGTLEMYNLFQGKIGTTGQPFVDPNTQQPTKYTLAGDPIAGTGWLDGQLHPPGDRRIGQVAGPFTMAAGDTQEVVVAQIAAGAEEGIDRLGAVGLLKFYDKTAQLIYDNFFQVVSAPKAPIISVAELDQKIVLSWGSDLDAVHETEQADEGGFTFQGYNVYQLPSSTASINEATRIATYDIADGVGKITDEYFDVVSGVVGRKVVQFGTDSGLKRYIELKYDMFNGGLPLVNGTRYYFAVTAYSYNPDPLAVPNNLENPLNVLTLVPHSENPGQRVEGEPNQEITINHTSGGSDGVIEATVIDPTLTTGNTYKVTFNVDAVSGATLWNLTNSTTGAAILTNQDQNNADELPYIDGMQISVAGPADGIIDWDYQGNRWISGTNWGGGFFFGGLDNGFNFFGSDIVDGTAFYDVELRWAGVSADNRGDESAAVLAANSMAEDPSRWSKGAVYRRDLGYAYNGNADIPFAAYDMESTPERRLNICIVEDANNGSGNNLFDMGWDGSAFAANGGREYIFIMDSDYNEGADYSDANDGTSTDVLYAIWPASRSRTYLVDPFEMQIFAANVNTTSDVFEFTAPGVTESADLAKEDVKDINVFPNPYYGVNSQELNKYQRFVTFNHLPTKATIRIFNLAGQLVRTIDKNSNTQFERWDLLNNSGLPVASGLYIVYVDMPDLGTTKILKAAIIQEQQILDRF